MLFVYLLLLVLRFFLFLLDSNTNLFLLLFFLYLLFLLLSLFLVLFFDLFFILSCNFNADHSLVGLSTR